VKKGGKILVVRFSAFGDVAMTVPVIAGFLKAYPEAEVVFVSRPFAAKLYEPFSQVHFVSFNPKGEHKGVAGIFRLFRELRSIGSYSFVADLHNVLRSRILGLLFSLSGIPVYRIDKGRTEKDELVRQTNKRLRPLKSTFQRYCDVFGAAGKAFDLQPLSLRGYFFIESSQPPHASLGLAGPHIGIAPFAGHKWKAWPLEKVEQLIDLLDERGFQVYLFGGRGTEAEVLEDLAGRFVNVHSLAGRLSIDDELKAMAMLDVMISMDSANMHLARLVNTPVLSIWGATHPYAGFYGWQLPEDWAVQVDLTCRPCSVFGNKECYRGDFACMELISPAMVADKLDFLLTRTRSSRL